MENAKIAKFFCKLIIFGNNLRFYNSVPMLSIWFKMRLFYTISPIVKHTLWKNALAHVEQKCTNFRTGCVISSGNFDRKGVKNFSISPHEKRTPKKSLRRHKIIFYFWTLKNFYYFCMQSFNIFWFDHFRRF